MIRRYERWLRYERESHARVLASIRSVPEGAIQNPDYRRILDLFAHVLAARRLWLHRFGLLDEGPVNLFPTGRALEQLEADATAVHDIWETHLGQMTDETLSETFEYEAFEGGRYQSTIEDILTQLFGHAWYHRGQIAQLVRALGGDPATTDFVDWTRERVD